MLYLVAFSLQPLEKYVIERERPVKEVRISAHGEIGLQVLWKRKDGLYIYAYRRLFIDGDTTITLNPKDGEVIYSSNFPYSLTGGRSPNSIVIIQNLADYEISITKMEVK